MQTFHDDSPHSEEGVRGQSWSCDVVSVAVTVMVNITEEKGVKPNKTSLGWNVLLFFFCIL